MEKSTKKRSTKKNQARKTKKVTENSQEPEPNTENLKRPEPTEEEIRRRAHEIYVARGGAEGYELDDWLQAERELRSQYEK
jgi:Protein of unknown function (DUF2934).